MLNRRYAFILRGGGTANGNQRFAGRVRDEMKVKVISRQSPMFRFESKIPFREAVDTKGVYGDKYTSLIGPDKFYPLLR